MDLSSRPPRCVASIRTSRAFPLLLEILVLNDCLWLLLIHLTVTRLAGLSYNTGIVLATLHLQLVCFLPKHAVVAN